MKYFNLSLYNIEGKEPAKKVLKEKDRAGNQNMNTRPRRERTNFQELTRMKRLQEPNEVRHQTTPRLTRMKREADEYATDRKTGIQGFAENQPENESKYGQLARKLNAFAKKFEGIFHKHKLYIYIYIYNISSG